MKERLVFPFTALLEMDRLKTALIVAAIDPSIGGVLAIGEKGSAKSTVVRSFAKLLPDNGPFVELPMGATEDMLAGTIDIEHAIKEGSKRHLPGIMARANNGILYVDEVNLLPNHLVDIVLDAAASGVVKVERDGISTSYSSRFVLAGTMNPEEGDLRPQLLDRFGLCVQVLSPTAPSTRSAIVKRRIEFDNDPAGFLERFEEDERILARKVSTAKPASIPEELVDGISALCARLSLSGMRGDITCAKAAAALAGFNGRSETSVDDVRAVALMALSHRRKRDPLKDDYISEEEMEDALDAAFGGRATRTMPAPSNYPPAPPDAASSATVPSGSLSYAMPSPTGPGGSSPAGASPEDASTSTSLGDTPNDAIPNPSAASSLPAGSSDGAWGSAGNSSSHSESQGTNMEPGDANSRSTQDPSQDKHVTVKGDFNFLSGVGSSAGRMDSNQAGTPRRSPGRSNTLSLKAHEGVPGRRMSPMPLSSSTAKRQSGPIALAASINRAATRNAVDNAARAAGDDLHDAAHGHAQSPVHGHIQRNKSDLAREAEQTLAVKLQREDLMVHRAEATHPGVSIICLDASGSMGLNGRIDTARSIIESLLYSSYRKREKVALVTFHDTSAEILLQPTGSLEVARARINAIETGGRTPLAQGILEAGELADRAMLRGYAPTIILLSDGHATYAPSGVDPYKEAVRAALSIKASKKRCIMVDTSDGNDMLRLGSSIGEAMGASLVGVSDFDPAALVATIRQAPPQGTAAE